MLLLILFVLSSGEVVPQLLSLLQYGFIFFVLLFVVYLWEYHLIPAVLQLCSFVVYFLLDSLCFQLILLNIAYFVRFAGHHALLVLLVADFDEVLSAFVVDVEHLEGVDQHVLLHFVVQR